MTRLPIDDVLPELLAKLAAANAVVLRAPTGAGKTSRVPPALLSLTPAGTVLLVEPRRVAARAAARRMAHEDGTPVGDRYGYSVRFDRKTGPYTRVVACTPGVVLRLLDGDPFLESVSAIVFDEFHERGLETDLLLGLVRLLRETVRPELRVVVMSATIDAGPLAAYLGDCPVVTSEGRLFPVAVEYRPRRAETPWPNTTADAIARVLTETPGDVLAFLPGLGEIRRTAACLEALARDLDLLVLPLHGDLPPEEQDRALVKHTRRKVVLATNVAETSVTVEGVTAVVDTGLARQQQFDATVGMDRLELRPISRAAADQRAGRAGRTQPGVCVRLWDEAGHRARLATTEPEIRRVDLANVVLLLTAQGEADVGAFPWLEPPPPAAVAQAQTLLKTLGALDDSGTLTDAGRALARLPVHPRVGRLLVEGARLGIPGRAALAAALLSERDPFDRAQGRRATPTASDVLGRVEALESFRDTGRLDHAVGTLHRGGAHAVWQVQQQLARLAGGVDDTQLSADDSTASLLYAILAAYPDRVAKRRSPGDSRARMVGGRGVRLAPSSGVEGDLFVCVDVEAGGVESSVRQASGVRREWLPAALMVTAHEVIFDEESGKLQARKQTRYGDLVLDDLPGHFADEDRASAVLAEAVLANLSAVLPDPESPAGQFRTRLRCLAVWRPDLGLPTFDDADLRDHLPTLCRGRRSLAELKQANWLDLMRGALTYQQQQSLDREAPDALEVPTGSRIALSYAKGKSPVLAVRIQEVFGLPETPRIAGGRVKVLLHLLAPNYRPQQVTDDLASFWAVGYALARKELRNRYPKHSWPENPLEAEAIRGPRKRT